MTISLERLAVVGTGLIGASGGARGRRAGVADVRGWDPDETHLATAVERGAVEPAADLAEAVAGVEIVARRRAGRRRCRHTVREVLDRAPAEVRRSPTSARRRARSARPPGTTRGSSAAIRSAAPRRAGRSARVGRAVRGRHVVPDADCDDRRRSGCGSCTASSPSLGAHPVAIEPGRPRPARRGHEPPAARARERAPEPGGRDPRSTATTRSQAAGGSLRDMTRVAGANPRIWVDIFLDNREALARRARRAAPADRAGRGGARRGRRRLPRALDRRGGGQPAAACSRRRTSEPGDAPAAAGPHPRPAGRAGRDLSGARRRADQRRGLRDASISRPSGVARSRSSSPARARPSARAALLEAQGYGVVVAPVIDE